MNGLTQAREGGSTIRPQGDTEIGRERQHHVSGVDPFQFEHALPLGAEGPDTRACALEQPNMLQGLLHPSDLSLRRVVAMLADPLPTRQSRIGDARPRGNLLIERFIGGAFAFCVRRNDRIEER